MSTPAEDLRVASSSDAAEPSHLTMQNALMSFDRKGFVYAPAKMKVGSQVRDETRPVVRTLIGTFETEALARFAVSCLNSLSHLDLLASRLVVPQLSDETEIEALRRRLGGEYWEDVRQALALDHAVLIVTIAEPGPAHTQAVLVEDASRLRAMVLPPEKRAW